jgi:integrase
MAERQLPKLHTGVRFPSPAFCFPWTLRVGCWAFDVSRLNSEANGEGRSQSSLSFHSLRHGFVSAMANAGVSSEIRQKLTGHVSAQMNAQYTHHEIEELRAAVSVIPRISA